MESWIYKATSRLDFVARRLILLIFSLNCDDQYEWKDISRKNLELPWIPSGMTNERENTKSLRAILTARKSNLAARDPKN